MKELTLLPVKPGTLSAEDKAALREAGVTVIEHENPSELRLLRPCADVNASDIVVAAMKALRVADRNYNRGTLQRPSFTQFLAEPIVKIHEV